MPQDTAPHVHAFVVCKDAQRDTQTSMWSILGVFWKFESWRLSNKTVDLACYYFISGINKPTHFHIQARVGDRVIWRSPIPIRVSPRHDRFEEGKFDCRVEFPDFDHIADVFGSKCRNRPAAVIIVIVLDPDARVKMYHAARGIGLRTIFLKDKSDPLHRHDKALMGIVGKRE